MRILTKMPKKPLIPKEVSRFVAAMLAIIVMIAVAAVVVDLLYGQ